MRPLGYSLMSDVPEQDVERNMIFDNVLSAMLAGSHPIVDKQWDAFKFAIAKDNRLDYMSKSTVCITNVTPVFLLVGLSIAYRSVSHHNMIVDASGLPYALDNTTPYSHVHTRWSALHGYSPISLGNVLDCMSGDSTNDPGYLFFLTDESFDKIGMKQGLIDNSEYHSQHNGMVTVVWNLTEQQTSPVVQTYASGYLLVVEGYQAGDLSNFLLYGLSQALNLASVN